MQVSQELFERYMDQSVRHHHTTYHPHARLPTWSLHSFYTQRLEDAGLELPNGCRQSAFFHFQEWKKAWAKDADAIGGGPQRIAPLAATSLRDPPPFRITTAGISQLSASGQIIERPQL